MSASATKRRRVESSTSPIDLSQATPPDSPVPQPPRDEAKHAGIQAPLTSPTPPSMSSLMAAPAAAQRSPSPVRSPDSGSGSSRPARAAKLEGRARMQAISVSLSDNREVSAKSAAQSNEKARQLRIAKEAAAAAATAATVPAPMSDGGDSDVQILEEAGAAAAAASDEEEEEGDEEEAEAEEEEEGAEQEDAVSDEEMAAATSHGRGEKRKRPDERKSNSRSRSRSVSATPARNNTSNSPVRKQTGRKSAAQPAEPSRAHSGRRAPAASRSAGSAAAAAASASASAAAAAASSAPIRKPRDLRRDKRVSGFSPWRVVPKMHVPAMTFEGYEDLATETLETATHAAIKASLPYEPQGVEHYHHNPFDLIYGKVESPLTLYRRVDTKYGRDEYKVKAQRNIARKEVVAFLGGRLMEQAKSSKQSAAEWSHHFHMHRHWLQEYFEYRGEHTLVVSTKDHKCMASYIRSPEYADGEEDHANIKTDVVLDQRNGLFFVIYFATEPIRRGQELFCQPFLGQWHTAAHREMFLYSRISHWYHKWALRLEQALSAAGVDWDVRAPSAVDSKARILTHEEEERFLTIPGQDQGVLPPPLPTHVSMKAVTMEDAMSACGCVYTPVAYLAGISPETQHYIDAVGEFIPHYLDIVCKYPGMTDDQEEEGGAADSSDNAEPSADGAAAAAEPASAAAATSAAAVSAPSAAAGRSTAAEPARQVIGEVVRVRVDRQAVLAMVRTGSRDDLVELREEFGINSPVRHFTPPNSRSFCVIAKKFIPQGTFVFCYGGEITEDIVNPSSTYVYTIEREQVRRTVRAYHGPELHLDALKKGNIARFVNDNTYRQGEEEFKGITANLETQFIFLKEPDQHSTIHLAFYTTRSVRAGEELISQYGENYWAVINKQLQGDHRQFYEYVEPYTRGLERLCLTRGVPLPSHPPANWTVPGEDLFTPKVKPYPPLSSPADDDGGSASGSDGGSGDAEEAFEVERILNMRVDEEGQVWYKVKWAHCPPSHNEWIPQRNVLHCQELIDEYNASQQAKPSSKGTKGTKHTGAGSSSSSNGGNGGGGSSHKRK